MSAQRIVETKFESRLALQPVSGVEELNERAERWCNAYNANAIPGMDCRMHRRGMRIVRLEAWQRIRPEQLRMMPEDGRDLAVYQPVERKVAGDLTISYRHPRLKQRCWYRVSQLAGVRVGAKVTVQPLLVDDDGAIRVRWNYLDEEQEERLQPMELDEMGLPVDGPAPGDFRRQELTVVEQAGERLRKLAGAAAAGTGGVRRQVPGAGRGRGRRDGDPVPAPRRGSGDEAGARGRAARSGGRGAVRAGATGRRLVTGPAGRDPAAVAGRRVRGGAGLLDGRPEQQQRGGSGMTVTRGKGSDAYQWVIPDGCKRVRPSKRAKAARQQLSARMEEYGIELWAGRGIFILQVDSAPVELITVNEAAVWFDGFVHARQPQPTGWRAYVAYCRAVGTTHDGRPLPLWRELRQRQRDGWEAAARA